MGIQLYFSTLAVIWFALCIISIYTLFISYREYEKDNRQWNYKYYLDFHSFGCAALFIWSAFTGALLCVGISFICINLFL